MEAANIPLLGIETQVEDVFPADGSLNILKNLVPSGPNKDVPMWSKIEIGDNIAKGYPFNIGSNYPSHQRETLKVLGAYWQERTFIPDDGTKVDLSRWLIVLYNGNLNTYFMIATKVVSGEHRVDGAQMCAFSATLWPANAKIGWQKINAQDVALSIYNDDKSYLFFVIGDKVFNGHTHNRINKWGLKTDTIPYVASEYPSGGYVGYLNTASDDKHFGVMIVYKLKATGTYIRHSSPAFGAIPQSTSTTTKAVIEEFSDQFFESSSYTDRLLLNSEKTDEVSDAHIAMTPAYQSQDEAVNSGTYYVVGKLEDFTKSGQDYAIEVEEDRIPTYEPLNIDPLSHHIFSGRTLGNYADNLLIGDLMTDYALPASEWWGNERLLLSGTGIIADEDPEAINDFNYTHADKTLSSDHVLIFGLDTGSSNVESGNYNVFNDTNDVIVTFDIQFTNTSAATAEVEIETQSGGNYGLTALVADNVRREVTIVVPESELSGGTPWIKVRVNIDNQSEQHAVRWYGVTLSQFDVAYVGTADIVEVEIETGQGTTTKRYQDIYLLEDATFIYFPSMLSYPDPRAVRINIWRKSGSFWYKIMDAGLKPHPALAIGYHYATNRKITLSTVTQKESRADPFVYETEVIVREPNKMKAANLNEYDLPLERTYQMKSAIVGFDDNTEEAGDQFGQYPLYILCTRHIHGGQSSETAFLSRIETITDDHGVHSQSAFQKYKNRLFFASKTGFHALSGNHVEDLHYSLKRYGGNSSFITNFLASNMYVGVSEETQEVVFTDGKAAGRIMVLNLEFNKWYEGRVSFGTEAAGPVVKVDQELCFMREDGGQTGTDFEEDWMAKWREGTADASIDVLTNMITFQDYSQMKKLKQAVLQCKIETSASPFQDLIATLYGQRTGKNVDQVLTRYTLSDAKTFNNMWFRSKYGSMNSFYFRIQGSLKSGFLHKVLMEYENRGRFKK